MLYSRVNAFEVRRSYVIGQLSHQSTLARCHWSIAHPLTSLGVSVNKGTTSLKTQETRRAGEKMADRFSRFNEERDFQVKILQELHVSETYWRAVRFVEPCVVQFGIICLSRWASAATALSSQFSSDNLETSEPSVSLSRLPHTFLRISNEYPDGCWSLRSVVIWPLVFDGICWEGVLTLLGWPQLAWHWEINVSVKRIWANVSFTNSHLTVIWIIWM